MLVNLSPLFKSNLIIDQGTIEDYKFFNQALETEDKISREMFLRMINKDYKISIIVTKKNKLDIAEYFLKHAIVANRWNIGELITLSKGTINNILVPHGYIYPY